MLVVILATQEAEIRKIKVRSQSHLLQNPILKKPFIKKGGVTQGRGPEFKPPYCK
jgi:hypothetical protein